MRNSIERACMDRWLGPVVLLLVALHLLPVVLHVADHLLVDAAALACVLIAAATTVLLCAAPRRQLVSPAFTHARRGPRVPFGRAALAPELASWFVPLRR